MTAFRGKAAFSELQVKRLEFAGERPIRVNID